MNPLHKVLSIIFITLLLVVVVLIFLGMGMSFRNSNATIIANFKQTNQQLTIDSVDFNGKQIRFMQTGNTQALQAIVFVHGAPGGMDMFSKVMKDSVLQRNFLLISVDRLGYGFSDYGNSETNLQEQANAVYAVVQHVGKPKVILFGHSFGAPIAALVATMNPNQIKNVVMAGGAVSAKHERFIWLAKLCKSFVFSWMISDDNRVSSDEKISHPHELQKIAPIWKNFPSKLWLMHGTKDWLVPYDNLLFLKQIVPKNQLVDISLEGESHFFINNVDLLRSVFLQISNQA